ncbi:MAG: hypothetical protein AB9846_01030 [Tenuifilaceae bacterium]
MKNLISLFSGLLVLAFLSSSEIYAQENQEKNKQTDLQKKKQILEKEKQKKELDSVSKKAQVEYDDELKQLFEEQKKAQEESKESYEVGVRDLTRELSRGERSIVRSYGSTGNYFVAPVPNFTFSGTGDNTTFTISKKIKEPNTFSSDFEYEVPENVSGLYFVFNSELETGTLKLTITKPNGKVFQMFSVAPVANVDWNKQIKVKEGEAKDYSGNWKITISTKDSKGYYQLRINSY